MMQLPTDEAQLKHIAAQLRKPEGEAGTEVAKMMNIGNSPMNLHTIVVLNPNSALILSIRPKQVLEKLSFTKFGFQ